MEAKGRIRQVQAGDRLLETGQQINNTVVVLDGLVKLYREDQEGNEFFMYHLESGQACALSMICALNQRSSAVSAKAVTDSTLLIVPIDYMDEWTRRYSSWYRFVVGTFRARFEELLLTIDHVAFRNMDKRLEFYLKRHGDTQKENMLQMTHAEIAQELNSSREVITRLLRKLADQGKIKLHRAAIEIVDL
ncbi:MAG: Crp/Fnr family transcriptional regulator [Lewinellaceae bacterium]|nr:Crp/Fnr family transcriptional regulator [Lewinellaceae bacterium]